MMRLLAVCLVIGCVGLAGCVGIDGSHSESKPTVGQELLDLKTALDKGVISQAEYETKKAEIMKVK